MAAGWGIVAALLLLSVVGLVLRLRHVHAPDRVDVHPPDGGGLGVWEVCRCGAARMAGDQQWQRHPAAFQVSEVKGIKAA
jgi:hypothetical protein